MKLIPSYLNQLNINLKKKKKKIKSKINNNCGII